MRIGRTIIDTDNMTIEEIKVLIDELRVIRNRKLKAEDLKRRMNDLLAEAAEEQFDFVDKDFGHCLRTTDFELWDTTRVHE